MKKTIIIGTVDVEIFNHLRAELDGPDYSVRQVQRGVNILLEILDNDIDLLILDVDLTGIIAVDILPVIRRIRPRLPVILITEDVNAKIRKMAAELGVIYQAYKPMTNAETSAIARATNRLISRPLYDIAAL